MCDRARRGRFVCLTEQKIELVAIFCLEQFDTTDSLASLIRSSPSYNFQKKKKTQANLNSGIYTTVLYLEAFCAAAKRQMIK